MIDTKRMFERLVKQGYLSPITQTANIHLLAGLRYIEQSRLEKELNSNDSNRITKALVKLEEKRKTMRYTI